MYVRQKKQRPIKYIICIYNQKRTRERANERHASQRYKVKTNFIIIVIIIKNDEQHEAASSWWTLVGWQFIRCTIQCRTVCACVCVSALACTMQFLYIGVHVYFRLRYSFSAYIFNIHFTN